MPLSAPAAAEAGEVARWIAEEVRPHESAVRNYLRRRFPSLTDSDDLVQESYVRLLRARNAGRVRQAKPYFLRVARHTACDRLRRERAVLFERSVEFERLNLSDQFPDPADAACRAEDLRLLTEAIRLLPVRCRETLVLRKLGGLSVKEIAARLRVSENTVAVQITKGMKRCSEYFRGCSARKERHER